VYSVGRVVFLVSLGYENKKSTFDGNPNDLDD
jgi:hypothetical protein